MAFDYKKEYERYRRYYLSIEPLLKKPKSRAYTAIIFSFLAISLFGWYAIRPTMQTIVTLQREISDRTKVNKQMEDKISSLIEAQAVYQNIEPSLPLIANALPDNPEPIMAATQIRALADENGVTITNFTIPHVSLTAGDAKKPPVTSDYDIALTATGGFLEIKQFIANVRSIRRVMQINSMVFAPETDYKATASISATKENLSTLVRVDLKIKVFYLGS